MGQLKLLYEGGKPQSGRPSFLGGVGPSRRHVSKEKMCHFLVISLHFAKGYGRYKTKVKVKNNFIQLSPPLIKITKEIRICQNHPLPFLADVICTPSVKVM